MIVPSVRVFLTCGLVLLGCCRVLCVGGSDVGPHPSRIASDRLPAASFQPRAISKKKKGGAQEMLVYVGTYTDGRSKGIYLFRMDLTSGQLTPIGLAAETANPSFLAIHPNHRYLYAVNEIGNFEGTDSGAVSAFALDPVTGKLTPLNQQSSRGGGPCHLIVDREGKDVLVANYGGGCVAVLPIQPGGRLGPATCFIQHHGSSVNPQRQKEPHAHSINLDAANRFALAADLGLDKILIYRFDPDKGTLVPSDPAAAAVAPGSGPRHVAFHPNGRWAYVINEMASTVTTFDYDPKAGTLTTVQTVSTLPEGFTGSNTTAEIQIDPSGRFLYGSNRGHDSLAIFAIDPSTGRLTPVGRESTGGKNPRNFLIDPTGHYLLAANQDSDNIVVFRIDLQTGQLTRTGQVAEVPKPVCIKMMPTAH
jgi:6-phosphogluconolactonase